MSTRCERVVSPSKGRTSYQVLGFDHPWVSQESFDAMGFGLSKSSKVSPAFRKGASDLSLDPVPPGGSGSARSELEVGVEKDLFEIDQEVLRGIPLHHALRWPRVWLKPNNYRHSHRSGELFKASVVVEALDTFLSHSWQTPGNRKYLLLLLKIGWGHGVLCWMLFTAIALVLRLQDQVDAPGMLSLRVAMTRWTSPLTYWLLVAGAFGQIVGLCLSTYVQLRRKMCFFDIACVHQGDPELLRRGISNIGGCLSVSKELWVLYHPAYFKSDRAFESSFEPCD